MKRWLIVIATVIAGAAVYAWFLDNFEKQPDREYVGYQGEARFNDFLAAELLLLKLDIESESRRKLRPSRIQFSASTSSTNVKGYRRRSLFQRTLGTTRQPMTILRKS